MRLNKQQKAAVRHKSGPLLIIAGAGTGKTAVITERVKYLIKKGREEPSEILGLTFTEKAAREMEERIDVALPYGYIDMSVSTFHRFCDTVLRAEALEIGMDPQFRLLTTAEAIQFLRTHFFEFDLDYYRPLGNPDKFIGGMVAHFSRLQDEDVGPEEYLKWAMRQKGKTEADKLETQKWRELSRAYQKYEDLKTIEGLVDFGGLITNTLKLFRTRPNILRSYREKYKHILIDEFQDTNFAQNQLAELLAGKEGNITVVADDDQAVYRFRGAAISNVVQFRKTYKKAKLITLTQNYRSLQGILDRSYDLIQHNNPDRLEVAENISKRLTAVRKGKAVVKFLHEDRSENEADAVAGKILELTREKYDYSDVAVLVRANGHADSFAKAFERRGVPYQFLGPGKLFKQDEVIELVSFLNVVNDIHDSASFYRVLAMEHFGVSGRELALLGSTAKKTHMSLFEAAEQLDHEKILNVVKMFGKYFKRARRESAGQVLYDFLIETGVLESLAEKGTPDAEKRIKNITKLFDKIKSYEVDHPDARVPEVVDWVALATELGESPLASDTDWFDENRVSILTVHSSKGLEFPVVFIVNLVSERFPSRTRSEQVPIPQALIKEILPGGDFHLEEERRLMYVGMTRARDKLYLTAADYYGEAKRQKRLSPFITEALGKEIIKANREENRGARTSFTDYKKEARPPEVFQGEGIKVDYLSYSQIETFKTCPLHYKLRHTLNVPSPPSAAQSLGISVHGAVRDIYLKKAPDQVEDALLANWAREGYKNKKHVGAAWEKALSYLTEYVELSYKPEVKTLALEEAFSVRLPGDSGERPLKVGGVMDRVDELGEGIEIIDYKTGVNLKAQKEVDRDLQLSLYALAASLKYGLPPEKITLSLYYFETQKKLSTKRSRQQLDAAIAEVYEVRRQIESSSFECSGSYFCQSCEFSVFCKSGG